jgi:hypothetical protein
MDNFKVWAKNALVILGVLFILLVSYMLGEDSVNKKRDTLPSDFKEEYMIGCIDEDTSWEFCECGYNYLNDNYTNKQILDASLEYIETDEVPDEMMNAAKACIDLY